MIAKWMTVWKWFVPQCRMPHQEAVTAGVVWLVASLFGRFVVGQIYDFVVLTPMLLVSRRTRTRLSRRTLRSKPERRTIRVEYVCVGNITIITEENLAHHQLTDNDNGCSEW